jgi:hypothetical protein
MTTYEGWANYPTWAVNLWLSNDEGTYHATNDAVRDAGSVYDASNAIESLVDDLMPELEAGIGADIMGWAFQMVEWREIAESWAADLDIKCDENGDYLATCDECGEAYDESVGDGYCGLCPSCADKSDGGDDDA